jgi:beta-barrel assembly-enhancing protease
MEIPFMRIPKILLSYLLVTMALFLFGCAVSPVTGKRELALFQVSSTQEVAIGEETFPRAVQQMGGEYPDAQLTAYVNEVGCKLGRVSHRPDLPYVFKVVNDSSPNAFALPGGFIAITRGLLVNLENEAQLAAVLGHELGHVTARHAVQVMQRGTFYNLVLTVLSGGTEEVSYGPLAQQAGQLAANFLELSYSRDQEREADRLGIDYMVQAGYNPQGAVQLQEFFYRKLEGGAEPFWLTGLFRTHPFSKERMLANQEHIHRQYPQALNDPGYVIRPKPFLEATAKIRNSKQGYELYNEARRLEIKNDLKEAVATYLQAAAAAPEESLILAGLGMAYLKAEDFNSARLYLARSVDLQGGYYYSRMGLGYVYLQQGEYKRAVQELEASMKLLPTLQGDYLLAEGYEKMGQRQKALVLYREVAQADPKGKLGQAAVERVQALEGL